MEFMLFIIGYCVSFLGTLAGGGGLIGMPTMLFVGLPIHTIISSTKFSNAISSFSSFYVLFRKKQIDWKSALSIVPFALLGGIVGGMISSSLSEQTMTWIALCLLSAALLLNMIKKPEEKDTQTSTIPAKIYPYLSFISMYDGMFGPGQATLLLYTYLHHGFSYLKAIAFTRFQTFVSCFGAFIAYFYHGHFQWKIALFLAAGSFLGAQTSVRIAQKLSHKHMQLILRGVTCLLIVQLIYRNLSL
jgi:uncharacterized protein